MGDMTRNMTCFTKDGEKVCHESRYVAPIRGDEVWLAGSARKLWLCSLGLLRKLGSSGSPGQLLQQQQTEKVNINVSCRQAVPPP